MFWAVFWIITQVPSCIFHSCKPKVMAVIHLEVTYTQSKAFRIVLWKRQILSEALCLALQFWDTSMRPFITPNGSQNIALASPCPSDSMYNGCSSLPHCPAGLHWEPTKDLQQTICQQVTCPERKEKHTSLVLYNQKSNPELLHSIIKARPSHLWKKQSIL